MAESLEDKARAYLESASGNGRILDMADFARSVVKEIVGKLRGQAEAVAWMPTAYSQLRAMADKLESEYGVDK
jgi:hypothetical protein